MVMPVAAPIPPVLDPGNNPLLTNAVDRASVQASDNGEARRVSSDLPTFVREPKQKQPVDNQPNQQVASQQDIEDIQRQTNLIPSDLKTGSRGSNIDFYV